MMPVAVSADPQRPDVLDALMIDTLGYNVVFVEPIVNAYGRIKQVIPDAIILYLEADDIAACALLSMLAIDRETSGIHVMTWATAPETHHFERLIAELKQASSCQTTAVQMN
jgi:hypothetical protein